MSRICDYCEGQLTKNPASGSGKAPGISNMCKNCRRLMHSFNSGIRDYKNYQNSENSSDITEKSTESLLRNFGKTLAKLEAIEKEIEKRNSNYLQMIEGKKPEKEKSDKKNEEK